VSGKGVAAALLMSHLHAIFRGMAGSDVPLAEMVARANRLFCAATLPEAFATLVATRLLPDGTELEPRVDLHKSRGTPNKRHGELPWQCRYCSHYRTCWPGVEERVVTDYRGTPSLGLYYRPEGEP